MLGRQQIYLEINENATEYDDLTEIMANCHLNNHFLTLAREVCNLCLVFNINSNLISFNLFINYSFSVI